MSSRWSLSKAAVNGFLVLALSAGCNGAGEANSQALSRQIINNSLHTPGAEPIELLSAAPVYDIRLQIDSGLRSFTVNEKVTYTNRTGTKLDKIIFQLPGNAAFLREPGDPELFSIESVRIGGIPVTPKLDRSVLTVPLGIPLAENADVEIDLRYKATVPFLPPAPDLAAASMEQLLQLLSGTNSTTRNYGTFSLSNDILSLDHWYAVIPRFSNGAFDTEEPSGTGDVANFDVSNFNVEITHPKDLVIATSGSVVDVQSNGASSVTRIHGAGMRDMTVIGSTKFQTVKKNVGPITVTAYFLHEDAKYGAKLAEHTANALIKFQDAFGPYPFKSLNVVEAPLRGGAGGMEYSGLITIGKQFLGIEQLTESPLVKTLLDRMGKKEELSSMFADSVEFIVAHEVAHQWWHGLIGSNSKEHPFADESLTNYSAVLYFEKMYGAAAAKKQEEGQLELTYKIYRLLSGKDISVDQSAASFKDGTQYGAIVYSKGALLYRELRSTMGDDQFFTFLKRYARENRFGFSSPDTIRKTLVAQASESPTNLDSTRLAAIFDKWSKETHGDTDVGRIKLDAMAEAFMGPDAFAGEDGKMMRLMINTLGDAISEMQ